MKKLTVVLLAALLAIFVSAPVMAQEEATPQEVYDMVAKAAYLMGELGEEGLPAFNDPKGEFAWKDTYVFATDCSKGVIAAHPVPQMIGLDAAVVKCKKTGKLILKDACELVSTEQVQTQGTWIEYWWTKKGFDTPQRKLTFILPVPNSNYQVAAGIWNDDVSLDELNKGNK